MKENIEETKNADLSPSMVARFLAPKKTWFVQRLGDKKVFAMEEIEAWKTLTNRSNWARHDFKIVGVSDGKTYAKIINESKEKSKHILAEIEAIEQEANKYRKTEERFVFDELLEPADPKVVKVKKIISEYDGKLEKKNVEYFALTKNVIQTAFDAEFAKAKKNPKEFPSNHDIMTPGAKQSERTKILRNMGQI